MDAPAEIQEKTWWKKPLVLNIVAAIIVLYFIQPILSLLWRFLLSNIHGIVNQACSMAALGCTDFYNFVSSATITVVFYMVAITTVAGYLVVRQHKPTQVEEALVKIVSSRTFKILLIMSASGVILSGTVRLSMDFEVMQIKASFYQRLTVLAPSRLRKKAEIL